jgi:spermidine synthase
MKLWSSASMMFPRSEHPLALSVLTLGATTIVTQTVLLRTFLSVFNGNELVIGIVLASWLVLTGSGSALGLWKRTVSLPALIFLQIALGLLPLATVLCLSLLKSLLFPPGTMLGIVESMYGSLVLLAPFCLVSGFLFTAYVGLLSRSGGGISRVPWTYGVEAAGSMIGGVLFTVVAIQFLTTGQTLIIVAVINLGVAFLVAWDHGARFLSLLPVVLVLFLTLLGVYADPDAVAKQWLFAGQNVVAYKDTPYGNITVTGQREQLNFFENSLLLFSTGDAASNEEAVHFAMVQRPAAKRVLLISGGISGMIDEILKYGVERVDYLEINPWLIDMGRELAGFKEKGRVHVIVGDARRYLHGVVAPYDVVMINLPDPGTAQINRYYTREFFLELKSVMSADAVVSLSILPSTEYLGHEGRQVSSVIYNTLRSVFADILVIPGMKNHFLASDGPLRYDIARAVDSLGIHTAYVNKFYLDDRLMEDRGKEIVAALDRNAIINRDFTPAAYYRQVQYWLSYFAFDPWVPAVVCMVLIGVLLVRMKAVSFCMFVGGAAGASLEVVLLLAFQILYGSLYLATGMIITAFMAGLAVGSLVRWRFVDRKPVASFAVVQVKVGLYALLLPVFLGILRDSNPGDVVIYPIFLLMTGWIGALIGLEFSLASRLLDGVPSSVAGRLYSTDLLGSAAGALVVSAFLIPLLGITWVCVIIGCLSMGGAVLILRLR